MRNQGPSFSAVDSSQWRALVRKGARALGIIVNERQIIQMQSHAEQLLQWNQKINLTAITDPVEMAFKHYVDAMAPVNHIPGSSAVLDIGSGGGFPGIILKIINPSLHLTLIDASRKKISFLKYVIHSLELDGIEAHHVRGEHLPKQAFAESGFDVVISRAFSALDRFVVMGVPVLRRNGMLMAMKGRRIEAEMQALEQLKMSSLHADWIRKDAFCIDVTQYTLPVLKAERSLVIMKYLQEK